MKTRVVSGFPGVGKSTLIGQSSGNLIILDSDSSKFSWENEAEKVRHPEWPMNYIEHIRGNQARVDMILVSSHDVVRNALVEAGIEFELVYPGLDMKDEYIKRYVDRGSSPAFVKLLEDNYKQWIEGLMKQSGCIHRPLGPGQYLADVL